MYIQHCCSQRHDVLTLQPETKAEGGRSICYSVCSNSPLQWQQKLVTSCAIHDSSVKMFSFVHNMLMQLFNSDLKKVIQKYSVSSEMIFTLH